MTEEAQEILNYLPLNTNTLESEYIDHLWDVASVLLDGADNVQSFSIMPFHLLFMLAIQYKALRISKCLCDSYKLAFTIRSVRDNERDLLSPTDPFTIGNLNEKEIVDLFKIIGLSDTVRGNIRKLINNRNDNLAHAKGGIERQLENRITTYLDALAQIQGCFNSINDKIAEEWEAELQRDEDMKEFVNLRLLNSYLCLSDFTSGKLNKFNIFG